MIRPLLTALLIAAPAAAIAQDARTQSRRFVEDQVIAFAARPGYQATIQFGEGERIENVAIGDSASWQVTPNRRSNLLFIKPASSSAATTNMTVVTDRHTYLFELRLGLGAVPVYLLRFTYPAEPATPASAPPAAASPSAAAALPIAATLNFAWTLKGAEALLPDRVFDDGRQVYLAWRQGRTVPAIFMLAPDGKTEGPVNFTASGDYLVVDGLFPQLILRAGKDRAVIVASSRARPSPASPAPANLLKK